MDAKLISFRSLPCLLFGMLSSTAYGSIKPFPFSKVFPLYCITHLSVASSVITGLPPKLLTNVFMTGNKESAENKEQTVNKELLIEGSRS